MAKNIHATISAPGNYVFAVDDWISPFNVGWEVKLGSGATASFTMQSTCDEINPVPGVGYGVVTAPSPTWTNLGGTWPATAYAAGDITSPIKALRLEVGSLSGGDLTVNIIQPMSIN